MAAALAVANGLSPAGKLADSSGRRLRGCAARVGGANGSNKDGPVSRSSDHRNTIMRGIRGDSSYHSLGTTEVRNPGGRGAFVLRNSKAQYDVGQLPLAGAPGHQPQREPSR